MTELQGPQAPPAGTTPAPSITRSTYEQILRSSILIGGSSVACLAIGMVRAKAVALLLGPAGFGLMGLYSSTADLARSIAALGVNDSGVRQIAEAAGSGDQARVDRTATILKWLAIALGVAGGGAVAAFSSSIAHLTFGDSRHDNGVALLSLVVFFNVVAGGQTALIQGMRRIGDLALVTVAGALLGTVVCIPLVYLMGENGIVPSLIAAAAASATTAWWCARGVRVCRPTLKSPEVRMQVASLLKLGMAFMASGFVALGSGYVVRLIVTRHSGLDAAGLYQAAWTLGGLYIGFILQAMGADFYPRLVGAAKDDAECNRLVNEQARVSLLLAGPGIMATLTLAPIALTLFYSGDFKGAIDILRWICLGMTLRVITWPMGYIIVAKSRQTVFFVCEAAWGVISVALAWFFVKKFGLVGAGIAFFGSYVFHGVMLYPVVRWLSGFHWSAGNLRTGLVFMISIGCAFAGFALLPPLAATVFGVVATLINALYSLHVLQGLISHEGLPPSIRKLLVLFNFAPVFGEQDT